jgi:chorismate mutase/prephenate dehydratase
VASRQAADAAGLNVMVENIEDSKHNITRFAVVAEQPERRTGRDKTTLMVSLPHHSGSLAKAIEPFAKNNVNMTWIESFPTAENPPNRDPTYLFFIDIDGHVQDNAVQRALEMLRKRADRLEVLGSYPRSDTVEG